MGFFDYFSTDPSFRDASEAELRYLDQVGTISAAKGWPVPVRDALLSYPWSDPFQAADAQAVYMRAWVQEPVVIAATGYSTTELANYDKHRNAIRELAEASGWPSKALDEASVTSQLAGTVQATAADLEQATKDAANPFKSPRLWLAGSAFLALYFIFRDD